MIPVDIDVFRPRFVAACGIGLRAAVLPITPRSDVAAAVWELGVTVRVPPKNIVLHRAHPIPAIGAGRFRAPGGRVRISLLTLVDATGKAPAQIRHLKSALGVARSERRPDRLKQLAIVFTLNRGAVTDQPSLLLQLLGDVATGGVAAIGHDGADRHHHIHGTVERNSRRSRKAFRADRAGDVQPRFGVRLADTDIAGNQTHHMQAAFSRSFRAVGGG